MSENPTYRLVITQTRPLSRPAAIALAILVAVVGVGLTLLTRFWVWQSIGVILDFRLIPLITIGLLIITSGIAVVQMTIFTGRFVSKDHMRLVRLSSLSAEQTLDGFYKASFACLRWLIAIRIGLIATLVIWLTLIAFDLPSKFAVWGDEFDGGTLVNSSRTILYDKMILEFAQLFIPLALSVLIIILATRVGILIGIWLGLLWLEQAPIVSAAAAFAQLLMLTFVIGLGLLGVYQWTIRGRFISPWTPLILVIMIPILFLAHRYIRSRAARSEFTLSEI